MRTSENLNEIAAALCKVYLELKNVAFDSINPHFKSRFTSLPTLRDDVIPVMAKHGIAVVQLPCGSKGEVGVSTRLVHVSGQWMEEDLMVEATRPGPQEAGSIITYFRRYAMSAAAGVASEEDDDGNAAQPKPKALQADPKYIDAITIKGMKDIISTRAGGSTQAKWKAWLSSVCNEAITDLSRIPERHLPTIKAATEAKEAA